MDARIIRRLDEIGQREGILVSNGIDHVMLGSPYRPSSIQPEKWVVGAIRLDHDNYYADGVTIVWVMPRRVRDDNPQNYDWSTTYLHDHPRRTWGSWNLLDPEQIDELVSFLATEV